MPLQNQTVLIVLLLLLLAEKGGGGEIFIDPTGLISAPSM